MKPHARIGHRGAVHLERSLQSSRKREKRGHLPLLRGIPARVEPDGMKRDDQHPADKRGAIIHVPVSVWFREGYGKLADWVCDGSGALLATACRTEVSNSDDTVRLNNQHSRGLTVGHAAHAVDFNRRPILSRQNVLALFRIPTASTNRAAELHEYQRSGFDDGEPFAVVQGYGKLLLRVEDVDSHGDAIAQRRAAGVPCDKLKSFCRMTVRNHRNVVERRHFVFSVVHQLQFDRV